MREQQAQRVRQATITSQHSLQLVQKLLKLVRTQMRPAIEGGTPRDIERLGGRLSVYHVSYLRGVLPESVFQKVNLNRLNGMELRTISPETLAASLGPEAGGARSVREAQRLVEWVEQGMSHALERGYLHKCFFGFAADEDAKNLLEEYVFTFSYGADGTVRMDLAGSGTRGKRYTGGGKGGGDDVNGVRKQICRLMRMLVEICNTLEPIPDERYVFVKLTYTPETPDSYEPPFFEPAGHRAVGCFHHRPFSMSVGKVGTRHHEVELSVRSVLDAVEDYDDDNDGDGMNAAGNGQEGAADGGKRGAGQAELLGESGGGGGGGRAAGAAAAAASEFHKPYADDSSLRASTLDTRDDSVSTAGQESVVGGASGARKRARDLDRLPPHAEEEDDEDDGRRGNVKGTAKPEAANGDDWGNAPPHRKSLRATDAGCSPGMAKVDRGALRSFQEESCAGTIASMPGSVATTSTGAAREPAPDSRPNQNAFPETQDSATQGTTRKKTSFVHQPLKQTAAAESGGTSDAAWRDRASTRGARRRGMTVPSSAPPIGEWHHREIHAHRRKVFSLAWDCEGRRLATGAADETVKVWRAECGPASSRQECELATGDAVGCVVFHPSEPSRLASAGAGTDATVRFWDARTGRNSATVAVEAPLADLAWSPDGAWVAGAAPGRGPRGGAGGGAGAAAGAGAMSVAMSGAMSGAGAQGSGKEGAFGAAWAENPAWCAAARGIVVVDVRRLRAVDVRSLCPSAFEGEVAAAAPPSSAAPRRVAFSPAGDALFVGRADGTVERWPVGPAPSAARPTVLATVAHFGPVTALSTPRQAPDAGKRAAPRPEGAPLPTPHATATATAPPPLLASGGEDGVVCLLCAQSLACLGTRELADGAAVQAAVLDPAGARLAARGSEGGAEVWDVRAEAALAQLPLLSSASPSAAEEAATDLDRTEPYAGFSLPYPTAPTATRLHALGAANHQRGHAPADRAPAAPGARTLAFSPAGDALASAQGGDAGGVDLWWARSTTATETRNDAAGSSAAATNHANAGAGSNAAARGRVRGAGAGAGAVRGPAGGRARAGPVGAGSSGPGAGLGPGRASGRTELRRPLDRRPPYSGRR